ncbi:nuclear transport factor 2 family protein [Pendulispora rubella]|uniref:Nuclear transport factor 2 family protein n=1 Tax=Pendulispora rubella TaxID=2741070 RepID=A0ABZ2KXH1_9BACT
MLSPLEVVQRQFDAYNRRNLDDFLANFHEDVKVFRPPSPDPAIVGKCQLADFYASERFNRPALKAELISRTVLGNKVFDHERIWGVRETAFEMMAVFEVQDGAIRTIWGFSAE